VSWLVESLYKEKDKPATLIILLVVVVGSTFISRKCLLLEEEQLKLAVSCFRHERNTKHSS
jgi:hypothetical protein